MCCNLLVSYFLHYTMKPEQQEVAATDDGNSIRNELSTLTCLCCKSITFNTPRHCLYIATRRRREQDMPIARLQGTCHGRRNCCRKGTEVCVGCLYGSPQKENFKVVLWYETGRIKYYKSFLVGYT